MVKARFVSESHGIVFFSFVSGDRTFVERLMMKPGNGDEQQQAQRIERAMAGNAR
jgi:hypothetical protein